MINAPTILAIDQGTSSSRAILFSTSGRLLKQAQQSFEQIYPNNGWVEHDPDEIWRSVISTCKQVILQTTLSTIATIGITNQRETIVVWDKQTHLPVYNAIVWQDRRTTEYCQQLRHEGLEPMIRKKTGLLLDPYFSASKLAWILEHINGVRARAERGELACGTIETFLLWRLTNGKNHSTDASNAARTLLFNIHTQQWDDELLQLFNIPCALLPQVKDNADDFGRTDLSLFGRAIPITGMAGDQQAALIGQACFTPNSIKSTYGTGAFMMLNTGDKAIESKNRLLTTVAYRLNGKVNYALEGSIFIAGAAIQWLRDELKIIDDAKQSELLLNTSHADQRIYFVPAFTGLGAPHWDPKARGAIFGLTRSTQRADIVRGALESVCFQTTELLDVMIKDSNLDIQSLRVDGGMVANNSLLQLLADILDITIERPTIIETTALGAAYLAGLHIGIFKSLDDISLNWQLEQKVTPQLCKSERNIMLKNWQRAVSSTKYFTS